MRSNSDCANATIFWPAAVRRWASPRPPSDPMASTRARWSKSRRVILSLRTLNASKSRVILTLLRMSEAQTNVL